LSRTNSGRECQEMGATVKLVDLDGCGGVRGKVNPKTQVQKPNLGHPPHQFGP
jgi:hypothetical protein